MKLPKSVHLFVPFVVMGMISTNSYAELSVTKPLMNATTLLCTFTTEQQIRWGPSGPLKEEGTIQYHVTFALIDHQTREAKRRFKKQYVWQNDPEYTPVRIRTFPHSITFFELTTSGELDPVMTTVLDDYLSGTGKYIAVRSEVRGVTAGRTLASQYLGSCVPE
jgi:hypothetical protein